MDNNPYHHSYTCEKCDTTYFVMHRDDFAYEDVCPFCGESDNIAVDIIDLGTQDDD